MADLFEVPPLLGGRFRMEKPIGEGSVATVFSAVDTRTGEAVAVKVLHPGKVLDPMLRERFVREGAALAQLTVGEVHPNIVRVITAGEDGRFAWLAMERAVETCHDRSKRVGGLPPADVLQIAAQALSALHVVHRRGFVHRDLKPANLLFVADGTVRVADFGLVRSASSTLTRAGAVLGTLRYMAPEQRIDPRSVTAQCDLFSLGVSMIAIACAAVPKDVVTAIALNGLEQVPLPLRDIVVRACQERPKDRFADAAEMRRAVLLNLRAMTEAP